ncbi:MAG: UDP-N-acetylmuramate dehydrogenase [Candidatus Paceibacterota bacterium]
MKLETNFLLSKITTFQLGGPARFYLKVRTPEEVVAAVLIAQNKKIKYRLVGGGSNLVFADQGFAGLVIHWSLPKPKLADLKITGSEMIVSAGVRLGDLIKRANKNGLAGFEKMAGIPGNVGGAVAGNAGAYGQTISDRLRWVEVFDGEKILRLTKKVCAFDYRDSIFKKKDWTVLRVAFKLKQGVKEDLIKTSREIEKIRWSKFGKHPICAGSFFKNVIMEGDSPSPKASAEQRRIPTATLIEQAGLDNLKQGGISVAPWHHNFLINDGTGTTKDLIKLKNKIKKVIHQKLGIALEEEVRFIV